MLDKFAATRAEKRIPMTIAVNISGHRRKPGTEMTFTENVSSSGARVLSARRWRAGDRVAISLINGEFRATARVVYCLSQRGEGFVIGLEFLEPAGRWILSPLPDSGNNLHG